METQQVERIDMSGLGDLEVAIDTLRAYRDGFRAVSINNEEMNEGSSHSNGKLGLHYPSIRKNRLIKLHDEMTL
jgi:hypothetical protein